MLNFDKKNNIPIHYKRLVTPLLKAYNIDNNGYALNKQCIPITKKTTIEERR